MVVLGIIIGGVLAVAAVIWSDLAGRDEDDRDLEIDHRAERFYQLADTADRLRAELGHEPSVREIYAAAETEEPEAEGQVTPGESIVEPVIDLRTRVRRITEQQAESSIA